MNSTPPIVYVGNDWFAENRTSSHHVARRLAGRVPLLYIEMPGLRKPEATARDFRKIWRKLQLAWKKPERLGDAMWRMTVPQIPFRRWAWTRRLNENWTVFRVRRVLKQLGWQRPIVWFTVPHGGGIRGRIGERLSVYYCVDDYSALPGVDADEVRRMDENLSRGAGLIFAVSRKLEEVKKQGNSAVVYSPHGVDVDLFAQASDTTLPVAAGARNLRHPVVGYFGLFDGRMDIDLVDFLAEARPDWTFLIVGHVGAPVGDLARRPNVVLTGAVPYATLPEWARAFDVCLMPYAIGPFSEHANPLKLREYLATGKPVVSTAIPAVQPFAQWVRQATMRDEFLEQLEAALREGPDAKREERWKAVAALSWDRRFEEILRAVADRLGELGDDGSASLRKLAASLAGLSSKTDQ
jgi:glycosyltransferase involved in cell wall biosynthesis